MCLKKDGFCHPFLFIRIPVVVVIMAYFIKNTLGTDLHVFVHIVETHFNG